MNSASERVAEMPPRALAQQQGRSLTAVDIRQRVNTIQEVMREVMKKDVHYGVIPGCKKPSLWKPGSEVLLATFQIGTKIEVTDLSTEDCIRYQVRVLGIHTPTGVLLGEGIGECSSNEEKYKWRKAYDDEFSAAPESRRRIKFGKYKDKQIRTEPADVANTILKMAKKRAQIDMTLTTTGASDCFDQDIEDLPEYLQPEVEQQPGRQAQAELPKQPLPDEEFKRNLDSWTLLIEGGKPVENFIKKVATKYTMTAEQIATLSAIKVKPQQGGSEHQGDGE